MKKSISLDDLNLFLNVVKEESLSKAFEKTAIPIPSISRRLTNLEDSVGGKLLNRSTRSISLTGLGEMYYERCLGPLSECAMITEHLDECYHNLSGNIKITAPINLTNQWIGKCIFLS
ncbi:LysR family transcriptional regulator [Enterobacteriaceae bacterium ESL0689]|nr:LysR family transcriptional regulator [Enterobacteriaceae bacterium ESL0689]